MELGRARELSLFFFFNDTATTEIYTLSLHDALPIWHWGKSCLLNILTACIKYYCPIMTRIIVNCYSKICSQVSMLLQQSNTYYFDLWHSALCSSWNDYFLELHIELQWNDMKTTLTVQKGSPSSIIKNVNYSLPKFDCLEALGQVVLIVSQNEQKVRWQL